MRRQRRINGRNPRISDRFHEQFEVAFPSHEYDEEPLALYWYALSASGMPLLEFLALYQVLEYYFPVYSKKEAGRQIRSIVKDPTFRPDREPDIGRLLAVVSSSAHGGVGSERQQLKSTINECVIESELLSYMLEDEERTEFFSKPHKSLTSYKVLSGKPLAVNQSDLAEAIYDIRCRIVHSKSDDAGKESFRLLPFSDDADQLKEYVELMKWLAQKVLISASAKLNK